MCECVMKLEDLPGEVMSRLMGPNFVTSLGWKERNSDGYFGTSTTMTTAGASHSRQTPIIVQLALRDAYRLPLSCTTAIPNSLRGKRKARGIGGKAEERRTVVEKGSVEAKKT